MRTVDKHSTGSSSTVYSTIIILRITIYITKSGIGLPRVLLASPPYGAQSAKKTQVRFFFFFRSHYSRNTISDILAAYRPYTCSRGSRS